MSSVATGQPREEVPMPDEAGEVALRVESHGIDFIPESERTGTARALFAVWAAPNVNYLTLVVGGLLIVFGLSLAQIAVVVAVGSAFTILTGVVAASGPAAGSPSEVVMRALFGPRANRVVVFVNGWFISVCYLALNWAAVATVTFELAHRLHVATPTPVKIGLILLVSAATLLISVYGHGLIMRLYQPLALVLTAVFVVVSVYVLQQTDWHYHPSAPLHGAALWAVIGGAVALIASTPLSYNNAADFARYLPTATPVRSVALWTTVGSVLPTAAFTMIGALAGTTLDMSDPVAALEGILPGWFGPVFLVAVILGTVANNAMTAYSSGLTLQAIGIKLPRTRTVLFDGTLGTLMTLYAVLVSNFLDTISTALQLAVVILGPVMSVYVADLIWRRNAYDGPGLADETPTSPYWYSAGINVVGVATLGAGILLSLMCASVTFFTGPIAHAISGVDISVWVGCLVPGAAYLLLMPRYRAAQRSRMVQR